MFGSIDEQIVKPGRPYALKYLLIDFKINRNPNCFLGTLYIGNIGVTDHRILNNDFLRAKYNVRLLQNQKYM